MSRNELCPCGSGKKSKKCCGAAGKQVTANRPGPAVPNTSGPDGVNAQPTSLFKHAARRISAEQLDEERKKHLRRRAQSSELRGTLVYNTGASYRSRP